MLRPILSPPELARESFASSAYPLSIYPPILSATLFSLAAATHNLFPSKRLKILLIFPGLSCPTLSFTVRMNPRGQCSSSKRAEKTDRSADSRGGDVARIVSVEPIGEQALTVIFKNALGRLGEQMLFRSDEARLDLAEAGRQWGSTLPGTNSRWGWRPSASAWRTCSTP
jgi:hypothetical protein